MSDLITSTSKMLSLVLRHKPEAIGLTLDEAGWADVGELLALLSQHGKPVDLALLEEVVETNDKQRFIFNLDGTRIRANQGHSVTVDLGLDAVTPPERLYHGTATLLLDSIEAAGLRPNGRQHVHLSAQLATAINVGGRHGNAVALVVDAKAMHAAGHVFYCSANGVWLTDTVPTAFLSRLSE